jgi:hypothetical protein
MTRHKAMTLSPQEFMRRFLVHVLPGGFHGIRHYGLPANGNRRDNLALARELFARSTAIARRVRRRCVGRPGTNLRVRALQPRNGGAADLLARQRGWRLPR